MCPIPDELNDILVGAAQTDLLNYSLQLMTTALTSAVMAEGESDH